MNRNRFSKFGLFCNTEEAAGALNEVRTLDPGEVDRKLEDPQAPDATGEQLGG